MLLNSITQAKWAAPLRQKAFAALGKAWEPGGGQMLV